MVVASDTPASVPLLRADAALIRDPVVDIPDTKAPSMGTSIMNTPLQNLDLSMIMALPMDSPEEEVPVVHILLQDVLLNGTWISTGYVLDAEGLESGSRCVDGRETLSRRTSILVVQMIVSGIRIQVVHFFGSDVPVSSNLVVNIPVVRVRLMDTSMLHSRMPDALVAITPTMDSPLLDGLV